MRILMTAFIFFSFSALAERNTHVPKVDTGRYVPTFSPTQFKVVMDGFRADISANTKLTDVQKAAVGKSIDELTKVDEELRKNPQDMDLLKTRAKLVADIETARLSAGLGAKPDWATMKKDALASIPSTNQAARDSLDALLKEVQSPEYRTKTQGGLPSTILSALKSMQSAALLDSSRPLSAKKIDYIRNHVLPAFVQAKKTMGAENAKNLEVVLAHQLKFDADEADLERVHDKDSGLARRPEAGQDNVSLRVMSNIVSVHGDFYTQHLADTQKEFGDTQKAKEEALKRASEDLAAWLMGAKTVKAGPKQRKIGIADEATMKKLCPCLKPIKPQVCMLAKAG